MKRYKLLKDLPTFKAGDEFFIGESGNLIAGTPENQKKVLIGEDDFIIPTEVNLIAYAKETLEQFPNILTEWFEEIDDETVEIDFTDGYYGIDYSVEEGWHTRLVCPDDNEEHYPKYLKDDKEVGLAFKSEEEAEKHLEWMKARATLLKDTNWFKPDWNDKDEWKYYVYYNHKDSTFWVGSMSYINEGRKIYFETKEGAENSIRTHEKEWKIYLGVE